MPSALLDRQLDQPLPLTFPTPASPSSTLPETRVNPLQALIQRRRTEKGWSFQDVAVRGGLPKSTVYKIATKQMQSPPQPDTLDRLARGLELPPTVVRQAAAESAGLTAVVDESETEAGLKVLIGSIESLTKDQRGQIQALVDAMVRQQQTGH